MPFSSISTVLGHRRRVRLDRLVPRRESASEPATETRSVWFEDGGWQTTPILARANLNEGDRVAGPAIVTQLDTTIVVEPGQVAVPDAAQQSPHIRAMPAADVVLSDRPKARRHAPIHRQAQAARSTPPHPGTERSPKLDPVTLAVIESALQRVCNEMDVAFCRSAFSPIISETTTAPTASITGIQEI